LERSRANEVIGYNLAQTISSYEDPEAISAEAQKHGVQAAVHIKIDTGLNRLGFVHNDKSIFNEIIAVGSLPGIFIEGIFTHFAESDGAGRAFTETQLERFNAVRGGLLRRGLIIPIHHCSNSAAILGFPEAHLNMVRPGISLYGGAGKLPGEFHLDASLRRVMSLHAKVTLVKTVRAGESVSYGRRFTAAKPVRIATIPVGYADGYSRRLSCGIGEVLIGGRRAPIAGSICMDMLMADVSGADGVKPGDEAVLYGRQGNEEITLEEVSKKLDTIPYEIMCAIGRRVPRVYSQNGKPVGIANYLINHS
jgi:alanine racemase